MGRIGCILCGKSRSDFKARTFVLITPAHPVLHQVSCSYEMIPNAPKHYETHQNTSLGSNGVDQVHSLQKVTMWIHGTNFCIYCTSSVCFPSSLMQLRNNPRCTQTLWYSLKHEFRVPLGGRGAFVAKMSDTTLWHELFSLIVAVQPKLHRVSYNNETIPNAHKHYETHQKMGLLSNGLDQVHSLQKCLTRLRGTNFFH